MRNAAFTITELMVGMLVTFFLSTAMLVFTNNVVYDFQTQRTTVTDRTTIKHVMSAFQDELLQAGYGAERNGEFKVRGADLKDFLSIEKDDNGDFVLQIRLLANDLEDIASAQEGFVPDWQTVFYEFGNPQVDPATGQRVEYLQRRTLNEGTGEESTETVLLGVTGFTLEYGLLDGTFHGELPENEVEQEEFFNNIRSLRISLTTETQIQDANFREGEGETNIQTIEQQASRVFALSSWSTK